MEQDCISSLSLSARLFVFSIFANISSSNEEGKPFLLVVLYFLRIFALHATLSKLSKTVIPRALQGKVLLVHPVQMMSCTDEWLLQLTLTSYWLEKEKVVDVVMRISLKRLTPRYQRNFKLFCKMVKIRIDLLFGKDYVLLVFKPGKQACFNVMKQRNEAINAVRLLGRLRVECRAHSCIGKFCLPFIQIQKYRYQQSKTNCLTKSFCQEEKVMDLSLLPP